MSDVEITEALPSQWGELFTLQRAAFVDEAALYGTPDVPSLTETLVAFEQRHAASTTLVATRQGRIVGAVSAREAGQTAAIERLMVAPDCRGHGIAGRLMEAMERHLAAGGHRAAALLVGALAEPNRRLYARLGYELRERTWVCGTVEALILEKPLRLSAPTATAGGDPEEDGGRAESDPRDAGGHEARVEAERRRPIPHSKRSLRAASTIAATGSLRTRRSTETT